MFTSSSLGMKETLMQIITKTKEQFSPYNILYEQLVHLPFNRPIYVLSLGKAGYQMAEAVLLHASREEFIRIKGGLVITKYGTAKAPLINMTIIEASHLNPDANSLQAGDAVIEFLQKLNEDDILLVLVSGGGTALMEKLVDGITLEEYKSRILGLTSRGASLDEIETERKSMSEVKGGKLYKHIKSKNMFIYAISDIPGDIPKYIASNPFLPDLEKTENKLSSENFHRFDNLTSEKFIQKDKAVVYKIVANNQSFCELVRETALKEIQDFKADMMHIIPTEISGFADKNGFEIAEFAQQINQESEKGYATYQVPCMVIFGGQTTLNKKGTGVGGRCTELALAAVEGISELQNCAMLTYATDGLDGVPEAAGAIIDNNTKKLLQEKGINLKEYLQNNDSFTALKAVNAIVPGEYTGINVNDIVLLYIQ
jgi:glycerate 2-kinase